MKKLYSLLSAVAVCSLSAAAVNPAVVETMESSTAAALLADGTAVVNAPVKAPQLHPEGDWTPVGEGTWRDDLLPQVSSIFRSGSEWKVNVEESAVTPGWYRFQVYNENSPWYTITEEVDEKYLYVNATDPDKVYMEDFFLADEYDFCQRTPNSVELTNPQHWKPAAYDPSYYGKLVDGVITFSEPDGILCVVNAGTSDMVGYYSNRNGVTALALPNHEFPVEWNEYGTATFQNAIIAPMFAADEDELVGELVQNVTVFKNVNNDNLIKFEGAWNIDGQDSDWPLTIDATNPTHCGMDIQGTGVEGEEGLVNVAGTFTFMTKYIANPLTLAQFDAGEYKDQRIVYEKTNDKETVTFKEQAVMFNFPEGSSPDSFYRYNLEYCRPSLMTISKSNGIGSITVDNSNAPVEYFNLQGIRVENPANGIYIRRQGTLTSKVFVR